LKPATRVRVLIVLAFFLLLEALCRTDVINNMTMIPPSQMLVALWKMAWSGRLWKEFVSSIRNVAMSFFLAVLFGTLSGALLHQMPRVRRVFDPLLASYYSVPFFALYPLFVVIFGLNDWPLILLGLVFSIVAVIVSTLNGIDRIPRVLLRTSRSFRMKRSSTLTLIILPAIVPQLFTGMKLALAYSFIGVLAGEFILASTGIGHGISFAYDSFDNETMYGLIAFTLILVTLMNMGLLSLERYFLKGRSR
jgi:NitT/TauT family transport system permease protein